MASRHGAGAQALCRALRRLERAEAVKPTAEHIAFMDGLKAVIGEHPDMPVEQILALASQFVGNLIALQDCRKYSAAQVMDLVKSNIEIGNTEAVKVAFDGLTRQ